MTKVLISSYYDLESGGTGVSTWHMAKALKESGYDVIIASLKPFPGIKTYLFRDFRKMPIFFLRDYYLERFISRIVKKESIDIIHCSDYRYSFVGSLRSAKRNNIKHVTHLRDYWFNCLKGDLLFKNIKNCSGMILNKCLRCQPKERGVWERYKFRNFSKKIKLVTKTDAVISISSYVADMFKNKSDVKEVKVLYDFFQVPSEPEHILGGNVESRFQGKRVIFFAGKLIYHKGVQMIMKVAEKLQTDNPDVIILVAGTGEMKESFEDYVENSRIKNILLLGHIEHTQIYSFMKLADIVYYPSLLQEPLGRTYIEAMMIGSVVVVSNVGGTSEIVKNNENGFLVSPTDVDEHVLVINNILNGVFNIKEISKKAIKSSGELSSNKVVKKLCKVYEDICNNN